MISRLAPIMVVLMGLGAVRAADEPADTPEQVLARQTLEATAIKGGLVVHLGCGEGRLTAALRASDAYVVHGLDADAANIDKARTHIRSLGLYGAISVQRWTDTTHLPYTDNFVNLVVAEDPGKAPMA